MIVGDEYWIHEHLFCEMSLSLPLTSEGMLITALKDGRDFEGHCCWMRERGREGKRRRGQDGMESTGLACRKRIKEKGDDYVINPY